jgi:tetratricopeptide (TPR) repeat protein
VLDDIFKSMSLPARTPMRISSHMASVAVSIGALLFVAMLFVPPHGKVFGRVQMQPAAPSSSLWSISIDYPENESIFPPGITPPAFLWRDGIAASWHIDIAFADGAPAVHIVTKGERMRIGPVDPDCVSATNEYPKLTPQQAAAWSWTPDAATWKAIQAHSSAAPANLTLTGYSASGEAASIAQMSFSTSADPVGAPIFYRDVPLMPNAGATGVVQPLSPELIHLIRWRLKDITARESRTVLTNMPTCANCHSFSLDGKTMGIDVDGPANDKGLYAVVSVKPQVSIQNKDVVQWNTDGQAGKVRVGFMSQVSPDGRYVVSTFAGSSTEDMSNTYYVTNFKDYKFLQVFYPTRGILEVYNRATGKREPLPGADDPRYVQTDGVWSPDQKWIVFARARAVDPYLPGQKKAVFANDPNETQIQYDLYRVPFHDGRGGTAEPIAGASQNGMSNNFPKVSPDGKWIVFVECRNGQLMRPDSQLYIVPFDGGTARRLRANTSLMNSWHSWSPNGRWLVFSSKARSPYTQMYLTHIDQDGNSSPAILVDNATASNRAVNLPEFVNIPPGGLEAIQVPAIEQYRVIDNALRLEDKHENAQALALWKDAVAMDPNNAKAQNGYGISLYMSGKVEEGLSHLRRAIQINPLSVGSHYVLGQFLVEQGHPDQAIKAFEITVKLRQHFASGEEGLASAYQAQGKEQEALEHWRNAIGMDPNSPGAMLGAAWLLATSPDASLRDGAEALSLAASANRLESADEAEALDTLAAAYAENREFERAISTATRAMNLAEERGNRKMAESIRGRIADYQANRPFHRARPKPSLHRTTASTAARER